MLWISSSNPHFSSPCGLASTMPNSSESTGRLSCQENAQAEPGPWGVAWRVNPSAPANTQDLGTAAGIPNRASALLGLFSRLGPRENVKGKDSLPPSAVCPGTGAYIPPTQGRLPFIPPPPPGRSSQSNSVSSLQGAASSLMGGGLCFHKTAWRKYGHRTCGKNMQK